MKLDFSFKLGRPATFVYFEIAFEHLNFMRPSSGCLFISMLRYMAVFLQTHDDVTGPDGRL